jgi:hypothetical protein
MSEERTRDPLITHLRSQVSELRRLERDGAPREEVEVRRRLVLRLQDHLAAAVIDALGPQSRPVTPARRFRSSSVG